jgi:hypothetical protein
MWPYGPRGVLGHPPSYAPAPAYVSRHAPSPHAFYAQVPYCVLPISYCYGYAPALPPTNSSPPLHHPRHHRRPRGTRRCGCKLPPENGSLTSAPPPTSHPIPVCLPQYLPPIPPIMMLLSVIVGNGSTLPITGTVHARFPISNPSRPLYLRNVLVAPNIVKDMLSVRQFTIDSLVSVEFDPLGISVKDLLTRTKILRCNRFGALYSMHPSSISRPHAFLVVDLGLWHRRLGHPGRPIIMESVARSSVIPTEKNKTTLCHACQLSHYVRLPFSSTHRVTNKFSISNNSL